MICGRFSENPPYKMIQMRLYAGVIVTGVLQFVPEMPGLIPEKDVMIGRREPSDHAVRSGGGEQKEMRIVKAHGGFRHLTGMSG